MDTREWVSHTLREIFETMLSMKIEVAEDGAVPEYPERVIGSIGLGGELVSGAVFFQVSEKFALEMAAVMLGIKPEEIKDDAEVNDVVSELSNMLAGGFKSRLSDAGTPCAMSTPSIIRGSSFVIEADPDIQQEKLIFRCGEELVVVVLHLKLTQNE